MTGYDVALLASLHEACRTAIGSHARGKALEDFVEYVFTQVPSVSLYARDVKDLDGAQELDLVLSHIPAMSEIPISDLLLMIECKNEQTKTSAAQVREFGAKLRSRSLSIGIFVTAAGLSGKIGEAAHAAIRDELGTGIAIIVVLAHELSTIVEHEDLARLLRYRLMELRTYRSYRSF
ncbi:restriction endonuclease [Nocardia sp. NPDC004573]